MSEIGAVLDEAEGKPSADDEREIESLYRGMLGGWNRRNAADMATLFTEDGFIIGLDGSSPRRSTAARS